MMNLDRPKNLTSLSDAYNDFLVNPRANPVIDLMGVVIDFLPPARNLKTKDYQITFTIQDVDMQTYHPAKKGLKARFFEASEQDLPQIVNVGDIILIRHCKIMSIFQVPMICNIKRKGSTGTSTSVFSPALIPEAAYTQTFLGGDSDLPSHGRGPNSRPSKSEQMYAFCLKQFSQTLTSTTGPLKTTEHNPSGPPAANQSAPALKTRKQKFQLISGVSYNDYCDLVVEVVKKYPDSHGNMELYVTDYTSHDALFDYPSSQEADADTELYRDGDPHGYISSTSGTKRDWTGPSGRHTLKVELFPPHAGFARDKVKEGDHLMLQNVRIKESNAAKMEGNLWQDRQYPDKVLVHHMRDKERPELKELLARKQAYWDSQKKEPEPMAKKKNRNRKKKKPKQNTVDESADDAMRTKDGGPKPIPAVVHNKHVTSVQIEGLGDKSLAEFLAIPRTYKGKSGKELKVPQIIKTKISVRVTDFWPETLEDFASPNQTGKGWKWDFALRLEDVKPVHPSAETAHIWVYVGHKDAEHLLKITENPTNLRKNKHVLATLREKMAILWGNLEERKSAAAAKGLPYPPGNAATDPDLSNLPFHACIQERYQELKPEDKESEDSPDYITIHSLFGVCIL